MYTCKVTDSKKQPLNVLILHTHVICNIYIYRQNIYKDTVTTIILVHAEQSANLPKKYSLRLFVSTQYYTNMTSLLGCQHDCLPRVSIVTRGLRLRVTVLSRGRQSCWQPHRDVIFVLLYQTTQSYSIVVRQLCNCHHNRFRVRQLCIYLV